jgi:hypothetical protein
MLPQFGFWIRKMALGDFIAGMIGIAAWPSTIIDNSLNRGVMHA